VNSGADLPDFTLSASDGKQASPATVDVNPGNTLDVNDAATITLESTTPNFTEENAVATDVVATFSTKDEDGDTVTVTLSDTVNYVLDGNTVVLTQVGADLVNSGADLPDFTLSATDGLQDTPATVDVNPGNTLDVNDAATITLESTTPNFSEENAVATDVVATFSTKDEDGDLVTVTLSDTVNYVLDGNTVVLTQAGADLVNSGADLPDFILSATDGKQTSPATVDVNPGNTIDVNDVETLTISNGIATEDSTIEGDILGSYILTDEAGEAALTVDFTQGTNTNNYYILDGTDIKLTAAGEIYLDSGNILPNISLTTSDGVSATNAVTTILVNDVETLTISNGVAIEDTTDEGTVLGSYTLIDDEGDLTVNFTPGSNTNNYYELDGTDVKLTAAGEIYLDAGNVLPNISLTTSDGVSATNTVTTTLVNDAPMVDTIIADQTLNEDFTPYTIDLNDAFNDVDSSLVFSVTGNSNIIVSISDGIATITPTTDWYGNEVLTFTATDPDNESVSQSVNFDVAAVVDINDDGTVDVAEGSAQTFNVLSNDNFEGSAVVTATSTPEHGAVSIGANGLITYTATGDYNGEDSFTYTVTAGGVTETAIVTMNVTAVNDAPTGITLTNLNVDENAVGAVIGTLAATGDVDDGDSHSYSVDDTRFEVVNGALKLKAGVSLDHESADSVTVTVTSTDSGGLTTDKAFILNVGDVNEAPMGITLTNQNVDENAVGAVIGTLATTGDV
ncbi:beta strand repeat-containing protein, partial [Colwellia sp. 75C3]|uniref:beta strand repeat-containing protein n=1 Tax=Colwellia sp. 75C3 TaxID=888425 RepID=UPI001E36B7CC